MQPQFLQRSAFESLEVKVKPSQCKHRTFSISQIGNCLLLDLHLSVVFRHGFGSVWGVANQFLRNVDRHCSFRTNLLLPTYGSYAYLIG